MGTKASLLASASPSYRPSTTNPNAASLNCSRTRACRYLWHGNVFQALRHLQFVEMDLESAAFEKQEETTRKLLKAVEEFSTYIERNGGFIPNYVERYRNGERISTGFVESAINQVVSKRMAKKQQMQWTQRGAHLLLQVRTRVLNEEWEDVFRRWYPDFRQQQSMKAAA